MRLTSRGFVLPVASLLVGSSLMLVTSAHGAAAAERRAADVITCVGTGRVTWSPGLTNIVRHQDWHAEVTYSGCEGATVDGDDTYPTRLVTDGTETNGCFDEVTDHVGSGTVYWSDGSEGGVSTGAVSESVVGGSETGVFRITVDADNPRHAGATITSAATGLGRCPETSASFVSNIVLAQATG